MMRKHFTGDQTLCLCVSHIHWSALGTTAKISVNTHMMTRSCKAQVGVSLTAAWSASQLIVNGSCYCFWHWYMLVIGCGALPPGDQQSCPVVHLYCRFRDQSLSELLETVYLMTGDRKSVV